MDASTVEKITQAMGLVADPPRKKISEYIAAIGDALGKLKESNGGTVSFAVGDTCARHLSAVLSMLNAELASGDLAKKIDANKAAIEEQKAKTAASAKAIDDAVKAQTPQAV